MYICTLHIGMTHCIVLHIRNLYCKQACIPTTTTAHLNIFSGDYFTYISTFGSITTVLLHCSAICIICNPQTQTYNHVHTCTLILYYIMQLVSFTTAGPYCLSISTHNQQSLVPPKL